MYKIGLSSCAFPLVEESFKALKENGIDAIEIAVKASTHKDLDCRRLKALSEQYGIVLWSYHLPFFPFSEIDPSSPDKTIRENTVEFFTELVNRASGIGIDKFVIHASGEPIAEERRGEHLKYAMESLDELAETAHKCGAVIAVEDLPRTCLGNTSDEICTLISANDKLRVCLDTNHLLKEDNVSFINKLSDKIVTVHISDYDFVDERHWLPGEGIVNWKDVLTALNKAGYNGAWMYEIGLRCPLTIVRDRDLTFADFYNNAKSIFSQV